MSDAELYQVIDQGIRLSGMPAMPSDDRSDTQEVWALVSLVRELPHLSAQDLRDKAGASQSRESGDAHGEAGSSAVSRH